MYESDEWYVQDTLYKKDLKTNKINRIQPNQTFSQPDNESHWDFDSSADDNESYEIETDGSQMD